MMNLGPEKAYIIRKKILEKSPPKHILDVGGYCGYSALSYTAHSPDLKVYVIELKKDYCKIARRIH